MPLGVREAVFPAGASAGEALASFMIGSLANLSLLPPPALFLFFFFFLSPASGAPAPDASTSDVCAGLLLVLLLPTGVTGLPAKDRPSTPASRPEPPCGTKNSLSQSPHAGRGRRTLLPEGLPYR